MARWVARQSRSSFGGVIRRVLSPRLGRNLLSDYMEENNLNDSIKQSLEEIYQARQQAEILRDQLLSAYHQLQEQDGFSGSQDGNSSKGCESLLLAIKAADHAIASIDQGLKNMARTELE